MPRNLLLGIQGFTAIQPTVIHSFWRSWLCIIFWVWGALTGVPVTTRMTWTIFRSRGSQLINLHLPRLHPGRGDNPRRSTWGRRVAMVFLAPFRSRYTRIRPLRHSRGKWRLGKWSFLHLWIDNWWYRFRRCNIWEPWKILLGAIFFGGVSKQTAYLHLAFRCISFGTTNSGWFHSHSTFRGSTFDLTASSKIAGVHGVLSSCLTYYHSQSSDLDY